MLTPLNNVIQIRCNACRSMLFEATPDTTGTIIKHCKRCKQNRTVKLPLQTAVKTPTINSPAMIAA